MSFRYIGSKTRLVESILDNIGSPNGGRFIDAFSGTGAVAEAACSAGWPVHVNDHLLSSAIMSYARVVSRDQANFNELGGYQCAIDKLNSVVAKPGFVWKQYSPASISVCGIERMYFIEDNAQKIDAMRELISEWRSLKSINCDEEKILIADLLLASNRVANTAGTYGCFLSKWQRQSREPLRLIARSIPQRAYHPTMSTLDVIDLGTNSDDTVYLDPPYTKRQYAAYYHILETIARGDEPEVEGVGGIRPWKHLASDYCYKVRAADALFRLVDEIEARKIYLSYSTEGHVPLTELYDRLASVGNVEMRHIDAIGRYRPNKVASDAGSEVGEVLFTIEKAALKRQEAA